MPEDVLPIAVRVLACYTNEPHKYPDFADVCRLRAAVEGEDYLLDPDLLAVRIIEREIERRRSPTQVVV